jgi:hypothetical protein
MLHETDPAEMVEQNARRKARVYHGLTESGVSHAPVSIDTGIVSVTLP